LISKRDRVSWKGYMPAVVTPFDKDRALDLSAMGTMLEWLCGEGMHGIVIAGTTGEWTSLSAAERGQLFKAVGAQLSGKLPIIAGCSAFTPSEAIGFAEYAAASGFDGLIITPPPYAVPNDDELVTYFKTIAAAAELPICIYNWPPGTNIDMSVELLTRLAEIDGVVAFKQSSSNVGSFLRTVFELGNVVKVFGYHLDELSIVMMSSRGGDGLMGAGGVLGRDQPDFFNHIWAGDLDKARECGRRDAITMKAWYTPQLTGRFGSGPAILKTALNVRGVPGGFVRAPYLDLKPQDVEKVRNTMRELKYI
jgi:4-hydroxy-tetrahydrodipicolinate synthase